MKTTSVGGRLRGKQTFFFFFSGPRVTKDKRKRVVEEVEREIGKEKGDGARAPAAAKR